jgi:uncharacterized membrane protein
MPFRVSDSHVRSVSKAISWRIVGSIDTFVITLLITGDMMAAGSIASLETISKIVLYYLHERMWSDVPLGSDGPSAPAQDDPAPSISPRRDRDDAGLPADAAFLPSNPSPPANARPAVPVPHTFPAALSEGAPRC